MNNDAYRNATVKFLAAVFTAASSLLLASCGGGGASGNPTQGGESFVILPNPATTYAGIPVNVTLAGGRKPYAVGSSEPSIFPVPAIVTGNFFTVVPQQPGVVDVGLEPGEVPRRSVVLTARDTQGNVATADFSVLQNFLLGYGVSITSTCPSQDPTNPVQACNGSESVVTIRPTFNGVARGNALLRFERVRGSFGFVQCGSPPPVDPTVVNSITTNTDHTGTAHVCIRIANNSPTQTATFRVIDVATGVYVDELFTIVGGPAAGALTAVPAQLSFTGAAGRCGSGTSDVLVYDGTPPYMGSSPSPGVSVSPTTSNTDPGRFTVTVSAGQPPCPQGGVAVFTDSQGRRVEVPITTTAGADNPPITATPNAITLACGGAAPVVLSGGSGGYQGTAPSGLVVTVAGNTATIATTGGPTPTLPVIARTVVFTDGSTTTAVTVNSPTTCGP